MKFKYYDMLSTLLTGAVFLFAVLYACNLNEILAMNEFFLICLAYMAGYILNAISALFEKFYYCTMGGKPSDVLLTPNPNGGPVGYGRIKFYDSNKAVQLLKEETGNPNATQGQMFGRAMAYSNSNFDTRVPDFNARYAFSRVFLTLDIIVTILLAYSYYCQWWFWVVAVIVFALSWNRCKENGYYYAKEVLVEYIKAKKA